MCLSHTNTTFVDWKWFQVWGQDIINPTIIILGGFCIVMILLHVALSVITWKDIKIEPVSIQIKERNYDYIWDATIFLYVKFNFFYNNKWLQYVHFALFGPISQWFANCNTCLQFDTTVCMHLDRKCWFWHNTIKCTYNKAPETGDFASL